MPSACPSRLEFEWLCFGTDTYVLCTPRRRGAAERPIVVSRQAVSWLHEPLPVCRCCEAGIRQLPDVQCCARWQQHVRAHVREASGWRDVFDSFVVCVVVCWFVCFISFRFLSFPFISLCALFALLVRLTELCGGFVPDLCRCGETMCCNSGLPGTTDGSWSPLGGLGSPNFSGLLDAAMGALPDRS